MKYRVYSVYDSKAVFYLPPFTMRSDAEAIRSFTVAASDANTAVGKHPGDFTLFCIGTYDDSSAELQKFDALENLGVALQYVSVNDSQSIVK